MVQLLAPETDVMGKRNFLDVGADHMFINFVEAALLTQLINI
jgi:hypothetical protein